MGEFLVRKYFGRNLFSRNCVRKSDEHFIASKNKKKLGGTEFF